MERSKPSVFSRQFLLQVEADLEMIKNNTRLNQRERSAFEKVTARLKKEAENVS